MKAKRVLAVTMAAMMIMSLTACGNSGNSGGKEKTKIDVTFDQIEVGKDYTDIKADLKFLTHKTDVIDTKFQEYIKEFQKMESPQGSLQATGVIFVWFRLQLIKMNWKIILQASEAIKH